MAGLRSGTPLRPSSLITLWNAGTTLPLAPLRRRREGKPGAGVTEGSQTGEARLTDWHHRGGNGRTLWLTGTLIRSLFDQHTGCAGCPHEASSASPSRSDLNKAVPRKGINNSKERSGGRSVRVEGQKPGLAVSKSISRTATKNQQQPQHQRRISSFAGCLDLAFRRRHKLILSRLSSHRGRGLKRRPGEASFDIAGCLMCAFIKLLVGSKCTMASVQKSCTLAIYCVKIESARLLS